MHPGIRHNNELYGLFRAFSGGNGHQAYHLARELTQAGKKVLVTTGEEYRVWMSLQISWS